MENEEYTKIMIPWTNGEEREAKCISLFSIKNINKKFLVYTFDEHDDNGMEVIHVSEVEEDENNVLIFKDVDPNDWEVVKDYFREVIKSEEE